MKTRPGVQQTREESSAAALTSLADSFRGEYETMEQVAKAYIREAVVRGVYRPGDRLSQDNIASALRFSRMPVSAALRQLEAEGLVTLTPHRGASVRVFEPGQIAEIYELRLLLESRLLDLAMQRLDPETLSDLEKGATGLDTTQWVSADDVERREAFYHRIYALADRPRTLHLVEQLRREVGGYLLLHRLDEQGEGHGEFLRHLTKGDRAGARRWLQQHLGRVSAELQRLVATPDVDSV